MEGKRSRCRAKAQSCDETAEWDTRHPETSIFQSSVSDTQSDSIQIGGIHDNDYLDRGGSCGVVRAVSCGHIVSGSGDHTRGV